jgi:iron complex transport system permease protein
LALAGLFMQAITKNPLAEPYITGISSGAGLAIVLSILFFGGSNFSIWGFCGAFVSSIVVILFAGLNRFSLTKLILVGLSVNIFVSSLISLLILTNGEKAYPLMIILSGGLTNNTVVSDWQFIALFVFALLACVFVIPKLNFLRLDRDLVMSSSQKMRDVYIFAIIILASFLTSLSVFSAGIIGFVGIIVPQVSKMLMGQDFRWLFGMCILLGSSLMLFSDYISRTIVYPLEIPLGLVIAFLGAPVFIFFLTKKGGMLDER